MIECLTAPTERPPFSQLGPTSSLCEKFGVDVMWSTRHGTAGLQRKEMCISGDVRVLTADLHWVEAAKIRTGDVLMGFDEDVPGPFKRRQWKSTEVIAASVVSLPAVKLTFDDDSTLVCSNEHRWLTYHANGTNWIRADHLQPQDTFPSRASRIVRLANVWEEDKSWEAGYLAGAYDGEGHLQQRPSRGNGHAFYLTISQCDNEMLAELRKYLDHLGFPYHEFTNSKAKRPSNWRDVTTLRVAPRSEALRFLGSIRPRRILGQFRPNMIGMVYSKPKAKFATLVSREEIGDQELIGLTTTAGTFVADGLASHNSDLVASVRDGRLGKELEQMKSLSAAFLCVEGTPAWDREGNLQSQHTRWTRRQHWGVMLSIQSQGVKVLESRNALETCAVVEYLVTYTDKDEGVSSLLARPGPGKSGWGRLDDRATAIHIYSGFPGVGAELATRIYDSGHRLIKCGMSEDELLSIEGVGKKKAASILKAFS